MNVKNSNVPKCRICASQTYEIQDTQIKINNQWLNYQVCSHCGFTYKPPSYHLSQSEEKKQYDFHENSVENIGYVTMFKRFIVEAIDPFITQGTTLDYGSGPGPVLYQLMKDKGFDAYHYDPHYHPESSVIATSYDLITSTEVFEHFYEPLSTIQKIINCLKPQGILAVMTTLRPKDDASFLSWWYRRDSTHVSFYTDLAFSIIEKQYNLERLHTNHKNIIVWTKR